MLFFRRNGKVELIENTQIPQIFLITKKLFQNNANYINLEKVDQC